ncbi:MAG: HAMP domain-containing protein, partial [Alphaproteobacteria bacterium]|nr:HAMP domain-containing protein [Alphaproteobacteria bacterium]
MHSISLRAKFTFLSLAVLVAVSLLAYTGYSAVGRLLELSKLETVNQVVRNAMELDMMHDAIHGDVQGSVSALHSKDAEAIENAKVALKDHVATSVENLKTMVGLELSDEVAASVKAAKPAFEAYTQQAEALLNILSQDAAHGTDKYAALNKEFEQTFESLEEQLGNTGDTVEAWAAHIKDEGIKTAAEVRSELMVILVIAIALAVSMPVFANLYLFNSLGKLVAVSDSLSQEEYDIEVPYTHRGDEIGRLTNSLESLRVKAADAFRLKTMVDDMPLNIMTADPNNEFKVNYMNK